MDIQGLMNAMSEVAQSERKNYHMSLGELIDFLRNTAPDASVVLDCDTTLGACDPHSYRGYYSDLALEPTKNIVTVKELHDQLVDILDTELTGYKGGEFLMDSSVPVWISYYGNADSRAVMSAVVIDSKVVLITKEVD